MILIDLNVLLDVLQKREPHYRSSAAILETVIRGEVRGFVAGHAVTTAHYIVGKYQSRDTADRVVEWLLRHFGVAAVGHTELQRARAFAWPDFEDAVVAAAAEACACTAVVTRNVKDFRHSPIPAMTPDEYLVM